MAGTRGPKPSAKSDRGDWDKNDGHRERGASNPGRRVVKGLRDSSSTNGEDAAFRVVVGGGV